jgi:hypothetical protein
MGYGRHAAYRSAHRGSECLWRLRHRAGVVGGELAEHAIERITFRWHLAGSADEAEELMRRTLESRRRVNGDGAMVTLTVVNHLGLLLLDRKKPGEAEGLFRELIAGIDNVVPEGHWILGQARVNLGECLIDLGKLEEARPWVEEGLERLKKSLPAGHNRIEKAEATMKKIEGK